MSVLDRLRKRKPDPPAADDPDRLRALELIEELGAIQGRRPDIARDPVVRAKLTPIVMRGL